MFFDDSNLRMDIINPTLTALAYITRSVDKIQSHKRGLRRLTNECITMLAAIDSTRVDDPNSKLVNNAVDEFELILAATRDVTDRLLGKTRIASISSWFSKGEVEQQIAALEYRVNSMYREFHIKAVANLHRNVLQVQEQLRHINLALAHLDDQALKNPDPIISQNGVSSRKILLGNQIKSEGFDGIGGYLDSRPIVNPDRYLQKATSMPKMQAPKASISTPGRVAFQIRDRNAPSNQRLESAKLTLDGWQHVATKDIQAIQLFRLISGYEDVGIEAADNCFRSAALESFTKAANACKLLLSKKLDGATKSKARERLAQMQMHRASAFLIDDPVAGKGGLDPRAALREAKQSAALYPPHPDGYFERIQLKSLTMLERFSEAQELLISTFSRRNIILDLDFFWCVARYTNALFDSSKISHDRSDFQGEMFPLTKSVEVWIEAAHYRKLSNESRLYVEHVLSKSYSNRSRVLYSRRNLKAALEDAVSAERHDPSNADAYFLQAEVYSAMGLISQAKTIVDRGLGRRDLDNQKNLVAFATTWADPKIRASETQLGRNKGRLTLDRATYSDELWWLVIDTPTNDTLATWLIGVLWR